MRTRVLLLVLAVVAALPLESQTYGVVTGSQVGDAGGASLQSGLLCYAPVDAHGAPIGVRAAGQLTKTPVCANVVNGAIVPISGSTFQLANTLTSYPSPFCYKATLTDNSNGDSLYADASYSCVQMNSNWCSTVAGVFTCNWDAYLPSSPSQVPTAAPTLTAGTFTTGAPGSAVSCTIASTGSAPNYAMSCTIPQGTPGPPGGSLSYPGVTSDGVNGLSVSGAIKSTATRAAVTNGWQRDVCSYSDTLYLSHGDKVRACIADAVAAGGGVCDSRCIDGADGLNAKNPDGSTDTTGIKYTTGTLPIEVGTPTVGVLWRLPDNGDLVVTQHGTNLPTAPAVTLSATTSTVATGGIYPLQPGVYWMCVSYKSGGGYGPCSTPQTFTVPSVTCPLVGTNGLTTANCGGTLTITSPPAVAYAYSYDVYIGLANSGGTLNTSNVTWQANCLLANTTCTFQQPLSTGLENYPTTANGVPAIIVHGGGSSGVISDNTGMGYALWSGITMNVSNVLATEDLGDPYIKGLALGSWADRGIVKDAVVLLQAVFSEAEVGHLYIVGQSNAGVLTMKASNDLVLDSINVGCNGATGGSEAAATASIQGIPLPAVGNCGPLLYLDNRHIFSDPADSLHNLTFTGLNLTAPKSGFPMVKLRGNPRPGAWTDNPITNVTFLNPAFEMGSSTGVTGIDITDSQAIEFISPALGKIANTSMVLRETTPCQTTNIRIEDATMGSSQPGTVFVNNTITGESITAPIAWLGQAQSYTWGVNPSPAAACTPSIEYVRGLATNADASSVGGNAATAQVAGGVQYTTQQLLTNGGFETSGTPVGTWSTSTTGGTITFTQDTTVFHSGAASIATHIDGSTSTTIVPGSTVANYGMLSQTVTMTGTTGSPVVYTVSFWAKTDTPATTSLRIQSGTYSTPACPEHDFVLTSAWAYYQFTCTSAISGSVPITFITTSSTATPAAGTSWIDDVMFGAPVPPIFPGFGTAALYNVGDPVFGSGINAPSNAALLGTTSTGAWQPVTLDTTLSLNSTTHVLSAVGGSASFISGTMVGSGTTATHTFSHNFTAFPTCVASPTSNVGTWYMSSPGQYTLTITYATSGTPTFHVFCTGPDGVW